MLIDKIKKWLKIEPVSLKKDIWEYFDIEPIFINHDHTIECPLSNGFFVEENANPSKCLNYKCPYYSFCSSV